jgi:hypothetical protein
MHMHKVLIVQTLTACQPAGRQQAAALLLKPCRASCQAQPDMQHAALLFNGSDWHKTAAAAQ